MHERVPDAGRRRVVSRNALLHNTVSHGGEGVHVVQAGVGWATAAPVHVNSFAGDTGSMTPALQCNRHVFCGPSHM